MSILIKANHFLMQNQLKLEMKPVFKYLLHNLIAEVLEDIYYIRFLTEFSFSSVLYLTYDLCFRSSLNPFILVF